MLRHCVGRPGFGYGAKISRRAVDIYSLRKPNSKAILTIEVGLDSKQRPASVLQVKGFNNRLPGFKYGNESDVVYMDELFEVKKFIEEYLGLDPFSVPDLAPGLSAWSKSGKIYGRLQAGRPAGERPNPGVRLSPEMLKLSLIQHNKPWGGCWYDE